MLHVVGRFTWDEVEAVANKTNIKFYPKVCDEREALVELCALVTAASFPASFPPHPTHNNKHTGDIGGQGSTNPPHQFPRHS